MNQCSEEMDVFLCIEFGDRQLNLSTKSSIKACSNAMQFMWMKALHYQIHFYDINYHHIRSLLQYFAIYLCRITTAARFIVNHVCILHNSQAMMLDVQSS